MCINSHCYIFIYIKNSFICSSIVIVMHSFKYCQLSGMHEGKWEGGEGGAGVIRGLWRHKQKGRDRRQKGKGRGGGGEVRGRLGKKEGQRRDHVELLPWNFCRQENNSRPGGGGGWKIGFFPEGAIVKRVGERKASSHYYYSPNICTPNKTT